MTLQPNDFIRETAYQLYEAESLCFISLAAMEVDGADVKIKDVGIVMNLIYKKIKSIQETMIKYADTMEKGKK